MKHIWSAHQGWNGLPTDLNIIQLRDALVLCIQEIDSAIEYDITVGGADWNEIDRDEQVKPYQTAIDALNGLLEVEDRQSRKTETG